MTGIRTRPSFKARLGGSWWSDPGHCSSFVVVGDPVEATRGAMARRQSKRGLQAVAVRDRAHPSSLVFSPHQIRFTLLVFLVVLLLATAIAALMTADEDPFPARAISQSIIRIPLGTLLAWFGGVYVVRQIQMVVQAIKRMVRGGIAPLAGTRARPELSKLAHPFTAMAAAIETYRRELRHREPAAKRFRIQVENSVENDELSNASEMPADRRHVTDRRKVIERVKPAAGTPVSYARAQGDGPKQTIIGMGENRAKGISKRSHANRMPVSDAADRVTGPPYESANSSGRTQALRSLNDVLERESERIANVLHDEAGQFLTSAHIALAEIARELPPPLRERLQEVRRDLDHIEERLRVVSHELHPRTVHDHGLAGAVKFLADGFSRRSRIALTVDVALDGSYPAIVETVVYRLVQEALTNLGKYSRATKAAIVLYRSGPVIHCSVRDNGIGFDAAATLSQLPPLGHGLQAIQDRLRAVGGTLQISSAPRQGTELRAIVPLETWNAGTSAAGGRSSNRA